MPPHRPAREVSALRRARGVVTAPGRQSGERRRAAGRARACDRRAVRVLAAEEEGQLALHGAVARLPRAPKSVAVCDVGGGSTEVVVGTPAGGAAWARSFDIGSLRLTRRSLDGDPPRSSWRRRDEAAAALGGLVPPAAKAALAVGGSARAVAKIVGECLGGEELERAVKLLSSRRRSDVSTRFRIAPQRAETLLAGVLILAEVQSRLGVPFRLGSGGVREGAVLELLAERAAA